MSNPYYTPTGVPAASSKDDSRPLRTEFARVAAGFDKFPLLVGGNNKPVVVNDAATGFTTTTGTLTLAAAFATTGAFSTTLAGTASVTLTLPSTAQTLATLAGTETLTSKTLTSAVFSGTITGTYTFGSGLTISGATTPSPVLSGTSTGTVTFGGTPTINATTFAGSTLLKLVNATCTNPTVSSGPLTMRGGYGGQIQFPSTQSASAGANTLDDYEHGNYTPTVTCVTPGDLSLPLTATYGYYTKVGRCVYANFFITGVPTYTTASGALMISLPFAASSSGMKLCGSAIPRNSNVTSGLVRGAAVTIGYQSLSYCTVHYMHSTGGTLTSFDITNWGSGLTNVSVMASIVYWTD